MGLRRTKTFLPLSCAMPLNETYGSSTLSITWMTPLLA